mgnify:CR=1 FL=1
MQFDTNQENWRPNIKRCLQEQWTRITQLLDELPAEEHLNYDDLTPRQQYCVQAIEAIEGEWLVDPEQREQLSVLVFD